MVGFFSSFYRVNFKYSAPIIPGASHIHPYLSVQVALNDSGSALSGVSLVPFSFYGSAFVFVSNRVAETTTFSFEDINSSGICIFIIFYAYVTCWPVPNFTNYPPLFLLKILRYGRQ